MKKFFGFVFFVLFAASAAAYPLDWSGINWDVTDSGGFTASISGEELIVSGTAASDGWSSKSILVSPTSPTNSISIQISAVSTGTGSANFSVRDETNYVTIDKHFGDGIDSYCVVGDTAGNHYVSALPPTSNYDNYKIVLKDDGYDAYCNGELVYSGSLVLDKNAFVRIAAAARDAGSTLTANYKGLVVEAPVPPITLDDRVTTLEQQIKDLQQENQNQENRIGLLEATTATINSALTQVQNSISTITTQLSQLQETINKILGFLSNSLERKVMVCGYMKDNSLKDYNALGLTCKIGKYSLCNCSPIR